MRLRSRGGGSFEPPVNVTASRRVVLPRRRSARKVLLQIINVDTIKPVAIVFDAAKNEANIRERGLPFSLVNDAFEWATAQVIEDARRDYGERRYRALGFIGARLHAVIYTPRAAGLHVISLRKANRREVRRYAAKAESGTD